MNWPAWMHDSEGLALLAAAKQNPLEKTTRLVLADWLQEQGKVAVARAVRKSMKTEDWEFFPEKVAHRLDPLNGCEDGWLGAMCPMYPVGLIDTPWFCSLCASSTQMHRNDGVWLPTVASLRHLVNLDLGDNDLEDDSAIAIAESPYLSGLSALSLTGTALTAEGGLAIANSKHLTRLSRLQIGQNDLGDETAKAIAKSPMFSNLKHLGLSHANLGDAGIRAIVTSPNLTSLTGISLAGNKVTWRTAMLFAESPTLRNLEYLDLRWTGVSETAITAIARSKRRPKLKMLMVSEFRGENLSARVKIINWESSGRISLIEGGERLAGSK